MRVLSCFLRVIFYWVWTVSNGVHDCVANRLPRGMSPANQSRFAYGKSSSRRSTNRRQRFHHKVPTGAAKNPLATLIQSFAVAVLRSRSNGCRPNGRKEPNSESPGYARCNRRLTGYRARDFPFHRLFASCCARPRIWRSSRVLPGGRRRMPSLCLHSHLLEHSLCWDGWSR